MFALFHFGFQIFKIAVQAALYTAIILTLKHLLVKINKNKSLSRIKFNPVYICIYIILFAFSFTYYGNHGLGDNANIPLGHWRVMNCSDGYAYFYLKPQSQINIDSFLVCNDYLCFISKDSYYSYHLSTSEWTKFNSRSEYEIYASMHNLPRASEFKTFYTQYEEYWNGWRFWVLP